MSHLRIFLCLLSFAIVPVSAAHARDEVNPLNYNIEIYNHGQKGSIKKGDQIFLKIRISKLFKTSTANTSEPWYKYETEKHGHSLEDRWNDIKSGSYFSLQYDVEKKGELPASSLFIPEEVIVEITDTPEDGFFGDVMAYNSHMDEIRAYQINHKDLVSLYCFEKTIPYLPDHYYALVEKYDTPEYEDSWISCNTYTDATLREIEDKRKAKEEKWRKIMQKKYGLKPLKKENE